jgi:organic radical activating enzyme
MSARSNWTGPDRHFKKDNKTFCVLPFVHIHVDTDGIYKPCCVSPRGLHEIKGYMGDVNKIPVEEIFNSDEMKQFRLDVLNGVSRPDICTACYQRDTSGFESYRMGQNSNLNDLIESSIEAIEPDGYLEPKLKSWDIRYSNLCNLKCRTCGDAYSTTWSKEEEDFNGGTYTELNAFEEGKDPLENQYENVENIYFAGGEPMVMPEHYATLTKLINMDRAKEIQLYYNSNMTKLNYNKHHMPDYWKEFKEVRLGLSIDHYGDKANYIRHGSVKWNKIETNIRTLREYSNIVYWIQPTVSLLNVYTLTDIHKYFFENDLIPDIGSIRLNMLYEQQYYSVKILPKNIKNNVQEKLRVHIEWMKEKGGSPEIIEQFIVLSKYLDEAFEPLVEKKLINDFISTTNRLDSVRNESFPATFPEYRDWWEEITKDVIVLSNIR